MSRLMDAMVRSAFVTAWRFAGSPTKVFRIQSIVLKKEGFASVEPTEEGVRSLVRELIEDRTLG